LHNNDKILQHDVSTPPSGGSIIIRSLNRLKKEVSNAIETSENIWGYVAGEGKFENRGQEHPGPKKGQKKFEKNWNSIGNVSSGGSIIIRSLNPLKKELTKKNETSRKYWGA